MKVWSFCKLFSLPFLPSTMKKPFTLHKALLNQSFHSNSNRSVWFWSVSEVKSLVKFIYCQHVSYKHIIKEICWNKYWKGYLLLFSKATIVSYVIDMTSLHSMRNTEKLFVIEICLRQMHFDKSKESLLFLVWPGWPEQMCLYTRVSERSNITSNSKDIFLGYTSFFRITSMDSSTNSNFNCNSINKVQWEREREWMKKASNIHKRKHLAISKCEARVFILFSMERH